jgi:quinol monooxygenase YgiN
MKILRSQWIIRLYSVWARIKGMKNQPTKNSIPVVLTRYHLKTSPHDKRMEIIRAYVRSSMQAMGNIMAAAFYEQGDPSIVWIMERWNDRASYNKNKRSNTSKAVIDLAKMKLASPIETIFLEDLELLSNETRAKTPANEDQPINVMLFVDVKEGMEDRFRSINREVIAAFNSKPDVLAFQFSRMVNHKTKFVVYKRFRNRDAFQYHLRDPVIAPVIEFLQTAIKNPPFEKGYHHLIELA